MHEGLITSWLASINLKKEKITSLPCARFKFPWLESTVLLMIILSATRCKLFLRSIPASMFGLPASIQNQSSFLNRTIQRKIARLFPSVTWDKKDTKDWIVCCYKLSRRSLSAQMLLSPQLNVLFMRATTFATFATFVKYHSKMRPLLPFLSNTILKWDHFCHFCQIPS